MSDRKAYREQANHIIQEAWEINGAPGVTDDIEVQFRILNGLLAIALTEFTARPATGSFGSMVSLRDVLKMPAGESE